MCYFPVIAGQLYNILMFLSSDLVHYLEIHLILFIPLDYNNGWKTHGIFSAQFDTKLVHFNPSVLLSVSYRKSLNIYWGLVGARYLIFFTRCQFLAPAGAESSISHLFLSVILCPSIHSPSVSLLVQHNFWSWSLCSATRYVEGYKSLLLIRTS